MPARTKGHPQSDLARPLSHRPRHDAVYPDYCQQHGRYGENAEQEELEPSRRDRLRKPLFQRLEFVRRLGRVHLRERLPYGPRHR